MPATVSHITFYLLTVFVMAGLWRWPFEPLVVAGWNVGLPAILGLSCADVAMMLALAVLAAWWLAAPVRHTMLRFGLWLWRSGFSVALLACILLLRCHAPWGPTALLAGCVLWPPLAVSFPMRGSGCDSASVGRQGSGLLDVPPHLPVRSVPMVAYCIAYMVVALSASVLSDARTGVDGTVSWVSSAYRVVASWSMVCCCCAIAALAHACRGSRRHLAVALFALAVLAAWALGKVPMGAALAPYGVSLAFASIACIWLHALHRSPASTLDRSASIAFFPVGVILSSSIALSLEAEAMGEPMTLLALELMSAVLLVAQALCTRSSADAGESVGSDSSCGEDRGGTGHPATVQGFTRHSAEARTTCARLASRYGLTSREESVIGAMAEGLSLARIAQAEGITKSTVGTYASRAYVKLGASSRAEALEIVRRETEREVRVRDDVDDTVPVGGCTASCAAGSAPAWEHALGAYVQVRRAAAVAGLLAWSLLAEAFVLPWLGASQSSWSLRGEAVSVVAFLAMVAVLMQVGAGDDKRSTFADGPCGDVSGHTEPARVWRSIASGAQWLQAAAILALTVLALAPGGMNWATMQHIGRGAVALVACSSGVAAAALAFRALWDLWCDSLSLRGFVAVPMAASLAFGCIVSSGALAPIVLVCGVACAIITMACERMGASATSVSAVDSSCDRKLRAERGVSLRIGLVRSVALVVAGASSSVLYYLLNGSYLALHPCWAASLVWHLVLHGMPLAAALCASMRAGRFARSIGRSVSDVLAVIVIPGLLGFACGGAFVYALAQPHGLGISTVAIITVGILCGAWALASVASTFRRRFVFSRRVDKLLSSVLAGTGVSDAELSVLTLLLKGFSTADVARELVVSSNTVRTHVRHIYAKLGVHSRAELFDVVEHRLQGYEDRL